MTPELEFKLRLWPDVYKRACANKIFDKKCKNLDELLFWDNTTEGFEYWSTVHELIECNPNSPYDIYPETIKQYPETYNQIKHLLPKE